MHEHERPTPGTDGPGRTLGIVGIFLAVFFNVVGLIVSIIALTTSREAGVRNVPAMAGIIIGAATSVLTVAAFVGAVMFSPWDFAPVRDVFFSWLLPITLG